MQLITYNSMQVRNPDNRQSTTDKKNFLQTVTIQNNRIVCPPRTPASIPTLTRFSAYVTCNTPSSQTRHQHHLRDNDSVQMIYGGQDVNRDSLISSSLQICKLAVSFRDAVRNPRQKSSTPLAPLRTQTSLSSLSPRDNLAARDKLSTRFKSQEGLPCNAAKEDGTSANDRKSAHQSHLRWMKKISNRSILSPEIVRWAECLKQKQKENSARRRFRTASWTKELRSSNKVLSNKLEAIGPHIDIYSVCHPQKVGPSYQDLNKAAVMIQKNFRGWLIRRKLQKLSRKASLLNSNFYKLAREYKLMLKNVQILHGVSKPRSTFTMKEFNEYMDLRTRYTHVFDRRSLGGVLERDAVRTCFSDCGLCPSQAEIDEAVDVTLHGPTVWKRKKQLTRIEFLNLIFYIYVPPATGLGRTRRSTWMNPIINGQEGGRLVGSKEMEPTPLAPCMRLVIETMRQHHQRQVQNLED